MMAQPGRCHENTSLSKGPLEHETQLGAKRGSRAMQKNSSMPVWQRQRLAGDAPSRLPVDTPIDRLFGRQRPRLASKRISQFRCRPRNWNGKDEAKTKRLGRQTSPAGRTQASRTSAATDHVSERRRVGSHKPVPNCGCSSSCFYQLQKCCCWSLSSYAVGKASASRIHGLVQASPRHSNNIGDSNL